MNSKVVLILALMFASAPASAAFIHDQRELTVDASKENLLSLEIDWQVVAGAIAGPDPSGQRYRTDARTSVVISSRHFNFIAYDLEYKVEKEVVRAYQVLDQLWQQAFGLATGGLLPLRTGVDASLYQEISDWGVSLSLVRDELDAARSSYTSLSLTQQEISALETAANRISAVLDQFTQERATLVDKVTDERRRLIAEKNELSKSGEYEEQFAAYAAARDLLASYAEPFQQLTASVRAFASAVELSKNGDRFRVSKNDAGTVVTVSVTPKAREGSISPVNANTQIDYAVSSTLPLIFHAGIAGDSLGETEFTQVSSLAGQDLFAVTKSSSTDTELVALLGYEFWSPKNDDRFGVSFTLGTELDDPGEKLYAGLSVRLFNRFFLTYGAVSGEVEEGLSPVVEEIATQLGTRELFGALDTDREWDQFIGLSFAIWDF